MVMNNPCSRWLWVGGAGHTGAPTCCSGSSLSCIRTCFWEGHEVTMRMEGGQWKEATYWTPVCNLTGLVLHFMQRLCSGMPHSHSPCIFCFIFWEWRRDPVHCLHTQQQVCRRFQPTLLFSSCLAACLHGGCQIDEPEDRQNKTCLVSQSIHLVSNIEEISWHPEKNTIRIPWLTKSTTYIILNINFKLCILYFGYVPTKMLL